MKSFVVKPRVSKKEKRDRKSWKESLSIKPKVSTVPT
jgi:hypothetical protein